MEHFKFTTTTAEPEIKILEKPEAFLKEKLQGHYNFGTDTIMHSGYYKYLGWAYNFKPFLKHYVYKQHGSWSESYALNKTNLRKLVSDKIDRIVDITNESK